MTPFARDGAHEKVACAYCHRSWPQDQPLPKVGWIKLTRLPEKKDLLFPVIGKSCNQCHFDQHAGSYGPACQSCHNTLTFKDVSRGVHDVGAYRLAGTHEIIPCWRCHTDDTDLSGTGDQCQLCHWEDDDHRNALGPFCGECHTQNDWAPARFNHAQVGTPLRGSHRLAACDGCHGLGTYQGTPQECDFCHTVDAAQVADPIHNAALADCRNCHNEVAFLPARLYHPTHPLVGAHRTIACIACHSGGTYVGTPTECFGCHQSSYYDPANSQNHVALGYSTDCEECHTQLAWTPATPPP